MGVHGLWKLLEPAGKPVPIESLENKILAVDVSIWLYQLTKGFQTSSGGAIPNAHLVGLFHRICKLLYYRIRPVFVFDGGVPQFKKETIDARRRQKRRAKDDVTNIQEEMLQNLLQKNALSQILGGESGTDVAGPSSITFSTADTKEDMFILPPLKEKLISDSSEEDDNTEYSSAKVDSLCYFECGVNINNIDVTSKEFKSLPPDIRHEILSELQATRKENSWAKIHEMPEDSKDFSNFQLQRLLKRRTVQISLDETAKELSGPELSFSQLEEMFKKDGLISTATVGRRIASDEVTRCIYVTNDNDIAENKVPNAEGEIKPQTNSVEQDRINTSNNPELKEEEKLEDFFNTIEEGVIKSDSSSANDIEFQDTISEDELQLVSHFENDETDLSQEQILQVIKQQQSLENKETYELDKHEGCKITEECDDIILEIGESAESESQIYTELSDKVNVNDTNILEEHTVSPLKIASKLNSVTDIKENLSENESTDSDDFIEVSNNVEEDKIEFMGKNTSEQFHEDNQTDEQSVTSRYFEKETAPQSSTETQFSFAVTIQPSTITEDDIFSDIFCDTTDQMQKSVVHTEKEVSDYTETDLTVDENVTYEKDEIKINVNSTINENTIQHTSSTTVPVSVLHKTPNEQIIVDKTYQENKTPNEQIIVDKTYQESNTDRTTSETAASSESNATIVVNERNKESDEKLSYQDLLKMQNYIDEKQKSLLQERGKQERLGSTISQQMILEAQELLRLFGLPYVVAPMEAEAQCAFMDEISLTEGTITDDSDIWLFGGKKVYKNFFDNRKFVLHFRANDIENFFKLTREQMIQLAMLVGSDYTVGLNGVGPVIGLEILAYFKSKMEDNDITDTSSVLKIFKEWWQNNRKTQIPLVKKLKDVVISEGFPNVSIINAYLHPTVDDSKETFSWAIPNLDELREYATNKFGWKPKRTDEILLPIMKRLMDRNKQNTLESYFASKICIPNELPAVSKRVQKAVNQLRGAPNVEMETKLVKKPRNRSGKAKVGDKKCDTDKNVATISDVSTSKLVYNVKKKEIIPQRELDRQNAIKRRAEAVNIFKSQTKKRINTKNKAKKQIPISQISNTNLSETSSEED